MRTSLRINDELLRQMKKRALETQQTLTRVIEDALRMSLKSDARDSKKRRVLLKTFKGKGLQPGVDLDDSAGLLQLMESNEK